MKKTKLIIDTDIGDDIDDAYALALCLKSPEVELVGVTTVYRNCEQRARIVKAMLRSHGREDVGVYAGEDYPLKEPLRYFAYESCLADGRPNIAHYDPDTMGDCGFEKEGAVSFLNRTVRENPDEITILAIGPLTNIARAIEADPEGFRKCKQLLMMGGDPTGESAEWNIKCDPEAAAIVLGSGIPIRLVGIDMTRQCRLSASLLERYLALDGEENKLLSSMMRIIIKDRIGKPLIMHDGLVASILSKDFCGWETARLRIETEGERRGHMTGDNSAPPMEVAVTVDSAGFLEYMLERLSSKL